MGSDLCGCGCNNTDNPFKETSLVNILFYNKKIYIGSTKNRNFKR